VTIEVLDRIYFSVLFPSCEDWDLKKKLLWMTTTAFYLMLHGRQMKIHATTIQIQHAASALEEKREMMMVKPMMIGN
jgi:hypothetical protein